MKRIPLYAYIAANNPSGGSEVLRRFNIQHEGSKVGIARGLRYAMVAIGEDAFREIAKVHPDKELILDSHEKVEEVVTVPESKSGACGCESCKSNAEGNNNSNKELIDAIKELKKEEIKDADTTPQLTKEDVAGEVKRALDETNPFVKHQLPYLALAGVIGVFIYGAMKK